MESTIARALGKAAALIGLVLLAGCALGRPPQQQTVIVITATFPPQSVDAPTPTLFQFSQPTAIPAPTTAPTLPAAPDAPSAVVTPAERVIVDYAVQPGDTLSGIAARFGLTVDALIADNTLLNPDQLSVGQVLRVSTLPEQPGSDRLLLPDSKLVRGPGARAFDLTAFIAAQPGVIRTQTDTINEVVHTAAQVVERVSLEYSIDVRLLLALLEYQSRWLSAPAISQDAIDFPMRAPPFANGVSREGLYRQLTWAADNLNRGYYGWKSGRFVWVQASDNQRLLLADTLNAATVGVQNLFALLSDSVMWRAHVGEQGLMRVYAALFGDPFAGAVDPLVPDDLTQPPLTLPFARGETWIYTGGPHGGWGSGSAWAAVDFAPPDDPEEQQIACYVSDYFVTAPADGVIARSGDGSVVLDLDGDGDEATGWTVLALHLATQDRIPAGTPVRAGDRLGRPSCEGGFSNGTHVHLARRYNGEWIPADCAPCGTPQLDMGGWLFFGLLGQEYQGSMTRQGQQRVAEQFRGVAENEVSW